MRRPGLRLATEALRSTADRWGWGGGGDRARECGWGGEQLISMQFPIHMDGLCHLNTIKTKKHSLVKDAQMMHFILQNHNYANRTDLFEGVLESLNRLQNFKSTLRYIILSHVLIFRTIEVKTNYCMSINSKVSLHLCPCLSAVKHHPAPRPYICTLARTTAPRRFPSVNTSQTPLPAALRSVPAISRNEYFLRGWKIEISALGKGGRRLFVCMYANQTAHFRRATGLWNTRESTSAVTHGGKRQYSPPPSLVPRPSVRPSVRSLLTTARWQRLRRCAR